MNGSAWRPSGRSDEQGAGRRTRAVSARWRLWRGVAWLVLGLVVCPLTRAVGSDPGAMVTDLEGRAWHVVEGRKEPLSLLDALGEGTVVGVDRGARLVLTGMRSPVDYELRGPSRAVWQGDALIGRAGNAPTARAVGVVAHFPHRLEPVNLAQASVTMRSAEGQSPDIVLREPVRTNVSDARVTFRWQGPGGPYVFELLDAAGNRIERTLVKEEVHRLGPSSTLGAAQTYQWRVSLRDALGRSYGAWGEFGVLAPDAARRIEATRPRSDAPFSRRLTYAALLLRMGLRTEAGARFRVLADERPQSARLRTLAR